MSKTSEVFGCVVIFMGGVSCGILATKTHDNIEDLAGKGRQPAQEFICEDDTTLTEQHVGVRKAFVAANSSMWRIEYVTGQVNYYNQPTGENCRLIEAQQ